MSTPGRKPSTVTVHRGVTWKSILIIGLLIASLSLLAALPLSFFFNGNVGDWFGNLPLDIIPPIEEPPPVDWDEWDIPGDFDPPDWLQDWLDDLPDDGEIPDWLDDWLDDLPDDWDGQLPPGDIPWWLIAGALGYLLLDGSLPGGGGVGDDGGVGGLPGMGGSMGNGLGPFGTGNATVWVSSDQAWRYWRIRAYDFFTGGTWLLGDNTTTPYTPIDTPGTDYTVIFRVGYTAAGYGSLPLPTLWNTPMIRSGLLVLNESGSPANNVTWSLLEDSYGGVHWNASIGTPGIYYIVYTVTLDESVTLSNIESNVYAASPLIFVADPPGLQDYLQMPDLSSYPGMVADMQALASNPAIATNNTYETAKAVMEYFKTRWWWTPYRAQVPGQDFDPDYLINNGYGMSSDFASNYVMYLRNMGISSRLVWGGVGYQNDTQFMMPMSRLSHSHFWAEVWIPNATNTGGEWVQFDPSPIPPVMWQPNASNPSQMIQIDARGNDDRVETSHYTMLLDASVPYNIPQSRGTPFNINGNLLRDGIIISTTWLDEPVSYTYIDVTENVLLGQNFGSISHSFDAGSTVGPHRFNASFYRVVNETIVTCNGTTKVAIETLDPHTLERGVESFAVTSSILDASNDNPISGEELHGWVVDIRIELPDNLGPQLTDMNGYVSTSHTFMSNISVGVYNFTMNFTGTFVVDYPDPYPDIPVSVPGSASQSQNETMTVTIGKNITLSISGGSGDYLPRAHTITFSGYLTFDNGTGIDGGLVTVWWENSTGPVIVAADYAASDGFYQCTYFVPTAYNDPTNGNDVYIYAYFAAVWGNCYTDLNKTYHIRCSNWTNIILNTDVATLPYVIREVTDIHVWGTLWDTLGVASTANQYIEIRVFETGELVALLQTDANGNFDTNVQIPITQNIGNYNLYAVFSGIWVFNIINYIIIPSSWCMSAMNTTHEVLVVCSSVLTKTSDPNDVGRVVTPTPIIAGDDIYVGGYLLFENGTPLGSQEVKAWWITQDGTETEIGSDNTNVFGYYNITYNVGIYEPTDVDIKVNYSAGSLTDSFILNASTNADPPVMWAVNISINTVTPVEVIRGNTLINIQGRLIEKHGWLTPNELIYLTLDGQNIKDNTYTDVTAVTNSEGFFSASFVLHESFPINPNYVVNATFTNSSFIFHEAQTAQLEVNCTTNIVDLAVDRTGLIGETITVSGRLVDNMNEDISGNVILLVNSSTIRSGIVSGSFNWDIDIPYDPMAAGMNNLILWHNGSVITYPSFAELWQNVPIGADVAITNIAGRTNLVNLTLNAGSTITVSGTLKDNESSENIFNRLVEIYYNNTKLGEGTTDTNGEYSIQITLPSVNGNTTIYVSFPANEIYVSQVISVEVITPTGFGQIIMQFLPWIIGIVAGIIAALLGIKLYIRRTNLPVTKVKYTGGFDLNFMKMKLKSLQEGKRFREAIIYTYHNFLQFVQGYSNMAKRPGQTAREFAMDIVKKVKIPPAMIYPFTTLYEEARFGHQKIDIKKFTEALKLFLNLHDRIMESLEPMIPGTPTTN